MAFGIPRVMHRVTTLMSSHESNGPLPEEPTALGPNLLNLSWSLLWPSGVKGGSLPSGVSTMSDVRLVGTTFVPRSNQN